MFRFNPFAKNVENKEPHAVSTPALLSHPKSRNSLNSPKSLNPKGFSLVELLIVVAIVGVLGVISFIAIQRTKTRALNERMLDDLVAIANALEDFRRDHQGAFPEPTGAATNQNVLCFYADATYADCADADVAFRQGMIDNDLLTKRYLREVPADPRTGSRYVYGVSKDKKFYQVAGIWENDNGEFEARTVENLAKGFELPSLVRAYDGPNFVIDREANLPYPSNGLVLTGTLENINGTVLVNRKSENIYNGLVVRMGDTIKTVGSGSSVDIYLSDGSVTTLATEGVDDSEIILKSLSVEKNDKAGTITKILIKLNLGKIWNKVARLASASEFRVETNSSIAGVRGTEFGVDTAGNVTLKKGKVWKKMRGDINLATEATAKEVLEIQAPTDPNDPLFQPISRNISDFIGYYRKIPLTRNNRPHILSIKPKKGSTTGEVEVTIRNVNYFANRISAQMGLSPGARRVQATTLAFYDANSVNSGTLGTPLSGVEGLSDDNMLTGPYLQPFDPRTAGSLVMRFEYRAMVNGKNTIIRTSGFAPVPPLVAEMTMDEKEIYPNLIPLETGFTLVAPDRVPTGGSFKVSVAGCPSDTSYTLTSNSDPSICIMPTLATVDCNSDLTVTTGATPNTSCDLRAIAELTNGKVVTDTKSVQVVPPSAQLTVEEPVVQWVPAVAGGAAAHGEASFRWSKGNSAETTLKVTVWREGDTASSFCVLTATASPIVIPGKINCDSIPPGNYMGVFSLETGSVPGPEPSVSRPFVIPSATNAVSADFTVFPTPNPSGVYVTSVPDLTLAFRATQALNTNLYSYRWSGAVQPSLMDLQDATVLLSRLAPGSSTPKSVTLTVFRKKDDGSLGNIVAELTKNVTVKRNVEIKGITFTPSSASLYMASLGPVDLTSYPVTITNALGVATLPTTSLGCTYGVDPLKGTVTDGSLSPTVFGSIPVTCTPASLPAGYVLGSSTPAAQLNLNVAGCGDGLLNGTITEEECDRVGGVDRFKIGVSCLGGQVQSCGATCRNVCTTSTPRIDEIAFCGTATPISTVASGTKYFDGTPLDMKTTYPLCATKLDNVTQGTPVLLGGASCAFATTTSASLIRSSGGSIDPASGLYSPANWGVRNVVCTLSSAPGGYTLATDIIATLPIAVQGCGDGTRNASETCDDGNDDGEGCALGCQVTANGGAAAGWACSGAVGTASVCKAVVTDISFVPTQLNLARGSSYDLTDQGVVKILLSSPAIPSSTFASLSGCTTLKAGTAGSETAISGTAVTAFSRTGSGQLVCHFDANAPIEALYQATAMERAVSIYICGNETIETGETCDDGMQCADGFTCNTNTECSQHSTGADTQCSLRSGDGCSSTCQVETHIAQCVGLRSAAGTVITASVPAGLSATAYGERQEFVDSTTRELKYYINPTRGTTYQLSGPNQGCWALGGANKSCNDACNLLDGSLTGAGIDCAPGAWNADNAVCGAFRFNGSPLTPYTISTTTDTTNAYAPFHLSGLCKIRNSGYAGTPAFGCDISNASYSRICKCQ